VWSEVSVVGCGKCAILVTGSDRHDEHVYGVGTRDSL